MIFWFEYDTLQYGTVHNKIMSLEKRDLTRLSRVKNFAKIKLFFTISSENLN